MAQVSRQIGWSQESNLLYQILNQLNKLTSVLFGLKEAATPNYKVFTALLSQSGTSDVQVIDGGTLIVGYTYKIISIQGDDDFTNVGAPFNSDGVYFIATGTTPAQWGNASYIEYDNGAPVVTVLENTIGNIWFTYNAVGIYDVNSNNLFTSNKTAPFISGLDGAVGSGGGSPLGSSTSINTVTGNVLNFVTADSTGLYSDSLIDGYPIEIRVYN
jgi:hypothetical protein